jgi:hypothetical protein
MPRKKAPSEEHNAPPAWIVSFSDMVTLLLAFFVLLQSFAKIRDPELFFVGQGSFKRAIAGLGIPEWLFGRKDRPKRSFLTAKHPTEKGPATRPKPRIIDAENDKIRNLFADLANELDITAGDMDLQRIDVEATPIRFDAGGWELGAAARAHLRRRVLEWRQSVQEESVGVYVIALAADESQPQRQWIVSARRAQAVASQLSALLGAQVRTRRWQVRSWGGGPGGPWCAAHGFAPAKTSVVIVLMKEGTGNG